MDRGEGVFLWKMIMMSLVFHFLWISLVDVKISSNVPLQSKFADITFLGSIFEKTSFETIMGNVPFNSETLYKNSMIIDSEKVLNIEGPKRGINIDRFPEKINSMIRETTKSFFKENKDTPKFFEGVKNIYYSMDNTEAHRSVDGPVKNRLVIFKPKMPEFFNGSFRHDYNTSVKFKFYISDEGTVIMVEPLISSGDPRIDFECMNYIRQWKFEQKRIDKWMTSESDWGVINIDISKDK